MNQHQLPLSQLKTLKYIRKFMKKNEYAPTIAEIAQGIGIKSRGVVHRYLKGLADAGLITITPKRHRNIQLVEQPEDTAFDDRYRLPLIGSIAAGQPIEAIPDQETIDIMDIFSGPHRYALKVKGDSMIDEGIHDGDVVICQAAKTANDGQIVVALIDNEHATLKRLRRNQDNTVALLPANSNHQPQIYSAERVRIQGIYIGLMRYYG